MFRINRYSFAIATGTQIACHSIFTIIPDTAPFNRKTMIQGITKVGFKMLAVRPKVSLNILLRLGKIAVHEFVNETTKRRPWPVLAIAVKSRQRLNPSTYKFRTSKPDKGLI